MRTYLIVLLALVACKKDGPAGTSAAARSPKDADALWAAAPASFVVGVVATPRALEQIEGGMTSIQALLQQAPELAPLRAQLDGMLQEQLGGPFTTFAELGLDRTRGAAMFITADGPALIIPVGDRAKLHARFELGADTGPAKLGPAFCKTLGTHYACAKTEAGLAALGKGQLPAQISGSATGGIGARGDIELVVAEGPATVALVAQLDRGAVVLRGTAEAPPLMSSQLGAPTKPRTDGAKTSAFAVANLAGVLGMLPDREIAPGLSLAAVGKSVNGPVTVTVAPGSTNPDVRIPVSDPGPATRLVESCALLVPAPMLAPDQQPGVCKLVIEQYAMTLEIWVEGQELRIGAKGAAAPTTQVAMTALGSELARTPWSLAFWGRGTMFGSKGFGQVPADLPPEIALTFRALSLLNELGAAVRIDGSKVAFVVGLRTLWANPPDVVAKLLAIPPADLARGQADAATAIAKAAPTTPFAADFASGQGGLMVPTMVVGVLAGVAIPAFMSYMQRSREMQEQMPPPGDVPLTAPGAPLTAPGSEPPAP